MLFIPNAFWFLSKDRINVQWQCTRSRKRGVGDYRRDDWRNGSADGRVSFRPKLLDGPPQHVTQCAQCGDAEAEHPLFILDDPIPQPHREYCTAVQSEWNLGHSWERAFVRCQIRITQLYLAETEIPRAAVEELFSDV